MIGRSKQGLPEGGTPTRDGLRRKREFIANALKILFVENHAVFAANVTREFLSRHAVTVVPGIAAARQARAGSSFDAVLVDYDLDDGKGDEFVRELRAAFEGIVIVGVSAHDEGNAALQRAGASAICSKMHFDQIESVLMGLK